LQVPAWTVPPLHALANGVDGTNGLYLYGSSSRFPTNSFNAANYWVDVIYVSSLVSQELSTGPVVQARL
jgi:hypothetical protein